MFNPVLLSLVVCEFTLVFQKRAWLFELNFLLLFDAAESRLYIQAQQPLDSVLPPWMS